MKTVYCTEKNCKHNSGRECQLDIIYIFQRDCDDFTPKEEDDEKQ